jgi:hypothetical protein
MRNQHLLDVRENGSCVREKGVKCPKEAAQMSEKAAQYALPGDAYPISNRAVAPMSEKRCSAVPKNLLLECPQNAAQVSGKNRPDVRKGGSDVQGKPLRYTKKAVRTSEKIVRKKPPRCPESGSDAQENPLVCPTKASQMSGKKRLRCPEMRLRCPEKPAWISDI